MGTPTTPSLQLAIQVLDPSDNVIASASAPAQGGDAVIETAPAATTGTYTIAISDLNGNVGQYSIEATLNAFVKTGTSNDTIATAQDLTGSSYGLDSNGDDRLAAVGSLPTNVVNTGDVYVSARYYGFYYGGPTAAILRVNTGGQVVQVIPVPQDQEESLSGVVLDPANNMLYAAVTTSFNGYGGPGSGSVDGELVEFNPITGQEVATIPLPVDNANYYFYYPVRLQHRVRRQFLDPAAEQRQYHPPGCKLQRDRQLLDGWRSARERDNRRRRQCLFHGGH